MKTEHTQEQIDLTLNNLRILIEELPKKAKEIPSIIKDFDMQLYGAMDGVDIEDGMHSCQTSGCLLGNTVYVIPPIDTDYTESNETGFLTFDYDVYGFRIFPYFFANIKFGYGLAIDNNLWDFLFHGLWREFDNTFEGAIARAKYVLKNHENILLRPPSKIQFEEGWHIGTEYETKIK